MPTAESTVLPPSTPEIAALLRQPQEEIILLPLPVLAVAGLSLIILAGRFSDPLLANLPGMALLVLPALVWLLHERSYRAAAWLLAGGFSLIILFLAAAAGLDVAIYLLTLATGLAALLIGAVAGALVASFWTLYLLFAPSTLLAGDAVLRGTTLIGIWGTVGLVWLTTRPLLTVAQWSWASYAQSRRLLEQARDLQVQLKQTMADLADANLQLTRLNRLTQALRQAAEDARAAKEQFVANVSHELRTPLNMIVGYGEMILQAPRMYGQKVPAALLADLSVIVRNSQHLSSLIDDVLDLSQIEAGQMALSRERVALREVIEAAAVAVRPLFDSKGLFLEIEAPEDCVVFCDRTRIREVVLNLLSNAGRFTEQGGVRIRVWRDADDVVVSVADTGPGIAADDQGKLFRPFQQLDGSLRRRYGGTGLGLAISKSFVELHGGRMWLESEQGLGTTFYFCLPVEPPAPVDDGVARWFSPHWHYEERLRRSLAPVPTVRPRFVVVEAEGMLRRLLSRYLDSAEVVAVPSLDEAVQALAQAPAQALLVNSLTASETLDRLQAVEGLPYGTPVIVCSLPGASEAAGALGASDYLVKPIARETLLATLDRLQLRGNTVLVVDDEPEALQLFRRMLASAERGYRVLMAANGRQALDILRSERPDVMLVDLVMPEMDGFRLLEARSQDPDLRGVPVVVISARDPAGQPIVSDALAVTRGGGLSVPQLLECIEAISRILGTVREAGDVKRKT